MALATSLHNRVVPCTCRLRQGRALRSKFGGTRDTAPRVRASEYQWRTRSMRGIRPNLLVGRVPQCSIQQPRSSGWRALAKVHIRESGSAECRTGHSTAEAPVPSAPSAVNCAGLPETLLESELFVHVRGSFTGAYRDKLGKLEFADHGTMFLDEIGEMTHAQGLLLRFLETGELQKSARSCRRPRQRSRRRSNELEPARHDRPGDVP